MDFGIRMRWLFSCSPHQIVDSSRGLFLFLCFLQSWQIDVLMSTWAEWSNHFRIRTAILCFALFLVAWIGCFASFSAFKPLRDIYALIPLRWINYLVSYEIEFTNCNTTNRMRRYSFRGYFTASEFQDWHYATYFRLSQMRTGFPPFFAISKSRRFFWFISWKTRYSPFKPATQKKKAGAKTCVHRLGTASPSFLPRQIATLDSIGNSMGCFSVVGEDWELARSFWAWVGQRLLGK